MIVNSEDIAQYEAKLKEIENTIAEINAEENFKIVNENVKHLVDDTENMNSIKMWQLRNQICKKKSDPPVAKKNEKGELVTESSQLKKLYETNYKK